MLILDGVYTMEQNGPRFHRVGAPDQQALERLLNRLVKRIVRRLTREGLLVEDPEQPWLDLEPTDMLDQLNAASVRYRIAAGQGAGQQNPHPQEPSPGPNRLDAQAVHRQSERLLPELRRLLSGPPARSP